MLLDFYPLQLLEHKTFDSLSRMRRPGEPAPIVIVEIDERSIQAIGPWPWPRSYIAEVVSRLSVAKPRVMGIHMLFTGPQLNPGLSEVKGIMDQYEDFKKLKELIARDSGQ